MNPRREQEAQGSSGDSWVQQSQTQATSIWEILRENQEGADFRNTSQWNQGDELRVQFQIFKMLPVTCDLYNFRLNCNTTEGYSGRLGLRLIPILYIGGEHI